MVRPRLALAVILCGALCCGLSCTVPPEKVPHFLPALEPFDPSEAGWRSTRKVLLIADCQLHNIFSKALPDRNLSIKQVAGTSIRPPHLDLFSADVLEWILANGAEGSEAILHLGDAIDLACEGELRDFFEVMQATDLPWLLVPGNHEFFYFGSYDSRNEAMWEDACYGSGAPLPKDRFVRLYVAAILGEADPGFEALADALGLADERDQDPFVLAEKIPDHFEWEAPEGTDAYLRAIAWNIDRTRPWRSFILQRADLSGRSEDGLRAEAILLDSCQYSQLPALLPNAWDSYPPELNCGLTGELLADQLRLARRWTEERMSRKVQPVFVCHHPVDRLASKSRSSLFWLWNKYPETSFITAHTHKGSFVHHEIQDGVFGLELNVGSTSDWPMEWRTLIAYVQGGTEYIDTDRFLLSDVLREKGGFFDPDWEVPDGAKDDYRAYMTGRASGVTFADFALVYHFWPRPFGQPRVGVTQAALDTETKVKDTLLWIFHELIRRFPTDADGAGMKWPDGCSDDGAVLARIEATAEADVSLEEKIAFLKSLREFEKSRSTRDPKSGASMDPERVRYKISQAVWASRFESTRGRRLAPEDSLIRVRVPEGGLIPPEEPE